MNLNTITEKSVIIGIDHGYGNIKTAHTCFRTGVTACDKEPAFKISSETSTRNLPPTR